MRSHRHRLWLWLFTIAWAALIFAGSADQNSSVRSSRILGPLVRWLVPDISAETLNRVVLTVRKGAHLTEYAVLAGLLWCALPHPRSRAEPWRLAWAFAVAYAISDEWHQALVPGRTGSVADVALDAIGAAVGLLLIWCWRSRHRGEGIGPVAL